MAKAAAGYDFAKLFANLGLTQMSKEAAAKQRAEAKAARAAQAKARKERPLMGFAASGKGFVIKPFGESRAARVLRLAEFHERMYMGQKFHRVLRQRGYHQITPGVYRHPEGGPEVAVSGETARIGGRTTIDSAGLERVLDRFENRMF